MRFVVYTKGERGASTLTALLDQHLQPVLCVSEDGDPSTVAGCAAAGVPHMREASPRSADHVTAVHAHTPDLIVCAGYSKRLPRELFATLTLGGINCHGGRLPEYRGASPIPWQIIQGETSGAAYVLRMTPAFDDGPVLASEPYTIEPHETARHVTDKVLEIFTRIIPRVVRQCADGRPPAEQAQDDSRACHWTRRTPDDGLINWNRPVRQVVDLVRGLDDPYPGAFVVHRGARLVIRRARAFERRMAGVAGRFVGRSAGGSLVLAADGAVEILSFVRDGVVTAGREFPAVYGDTFTAVGEG